MIISLCMVLSARHEFWDNRAIIIDKKVAVRSGPNKSFPTSLYIHSGTTVRVEKTVNQWAKVTLNNTITGWVEGSQFWALIDRQ